MRKKINDARRVLFESAIEAFSTRGYAGTSMADILKPTGLSKPTLYYYFGSKAGLFRAILDFALDEPYRRMREAVSGSQTTPEKLVSLAAVLFEFCRTHQHITRLALSSIFAAPQEIPPDSLDPAKRRRNFEFFLGVIREGQRQGELNVRHDAVELTHEIYGSISHRIRTHLAVGSGRLDRRRAERVVALFLEGARQPR